MEALSCITGTLWEESIGHQWFLLTKKSAIPEHWYMHSAPVRSVEIKNLVGDDVRWNDTEVTPLLCDIIFLLWSRVH